MMDRIIAAFTFKPGVYKEVEDDTTFTSSAWMIVAVVAFLSGLGSTAAAADGIGAGWIFGAIFAALFSVGGFALGAFVIGWVGKTFFNADVTFDELVRTLGLAYVWNVVQFLNIITLAGSGMRWISRPITFLAGLAGLFAWFMAAKEALDLEWPQTIGTVIIGWIVMAIVTAIASGLLAVFGLVSVSTLMGAL
ncbi:YIP1 family protein [Pelolinea submarina]|uniref:Yip1 domain-containing protein n=1 Tax=Pelolinea submarina TaxID=913107 RepID=A0A347ZR38_9CHLR|nr:YIP1 family protein [Pelolinea submarina]REG11677.1 hypothetical protein DFR64_1569 [Pelolinea submarina]BBB47769.1 hypothetical protein Pelsub_P0996 [Pelolinea submarina]